jgi:uncharacterized protein (TIGR02246 family)
MINPTRPALSQNFDTEPIEAFIAELQQAIDTGDAVLFNQRFAKDILWGSPFAAIASGYDQIHAIHKQMFGSVTPVKGISKYQADHILFVSENVAFAYVRRIAKNPDVGGKETKPGSFDELALFVLVKENEQWWLAAAQHVPDRRNIYLK